MHGPNEEIFHRPVRDERIEAIIDNVQTWGALRTLVGETKYAGHDKDPRPMPQWTLHDVKMRHERGLQGAHESGVRNVPDALWFGFCSDRLRLEPFEAIAVPKEHLWWLVNRHDTILLSDGVTHHYSGIFRVDRENERIYFADPWPEMFFLKEGLNVAGVRAQMEGGLNISKKEFFRVAVGLITLDTPELIEHYLANFPEQWNNSEINLRFGMALLDVQKNRLARIAAVYLRQSLTLENERKTKADIPLASQKLYFALNLAILSERYTNKDLLLVKPYQDELNQLENRFGEAKLLQALDVEEHCSLGYAAGHTRDIDISEKHLNLAVSKDPNHENARWLRTKIAVMKENYAAVIEDATIALKLNAQKVKETKKRRAERDPRDRNGIGEDEGLLNVLADRRFEVLSNRSTALAVMKRYDEARTDLHEILDLRPEQASAYFALGFIDFDTGREDEAKDLVQKAIELEKQQSKRAQYELFLNEKISKNDLRCGTLDKIPEGENKND